MWRCSTSAKLLATATSIEAIGQNAECIRNYESNKLIFIKMRHIINILVSIATICQFFASVFNMLNMKKPETIEDSLYNDFVLIGCSCSFIIGLIFILTYNFRCKFLNSKTINLSFLVIVLFAVYVHIYQLFIQKDLMLVSGILLLVDIFVGIKGVKQLCKAR